MNLTDGNPHASGTVEAQAWEAGRWQAMYELAKGDCDALRLRLAEAEAERQCAVCNLTTVRE